jgi:GNAT superfamily N-acetyltransferase
VPVLIRPIRRHEPADLAFIRDELVHHWGDAGIWSVGRRYQADELPGFIAVADSNVASRIGLVTYHIEEGGYQAEIVTLSSRMENQGIGAALLDAATSAIRRAGCARAYLRTTNDNLRALGFYQKRGWTLAALHKGCVEEARKHKAIIPLTGMHGIVIRDEIELEMWLQ